MKAKIKISVNGEPHSEFEQEMVSDGKNEIMRVNFDTPVNLSGKDIMTFNGFIERSEDEM